ncbi:DNA repair protein [Fluoribacter gormanii]|uniref:Nickel/cobalt efflux system n=1 Tax=Fluoribacter gormanii TaxID=464 RepID=A0A377GLF7_9GAMM|nr:DNA repair protein [Fluoribacter gormanii]KTD01786.1 high-affinity nickel-transport protein [Fluoribacter gormanii]MCW8471439.1 DNA repair protein [Fluoribacter gormanii]SIR20711.1 high-affinity nickel-transport protein [Fluoribacter gormanii]STO25444.1 High-affinity nickel-transport protein nixA [Fluoribacter gormanii]
MENSGLLLIAMAFLLGLRHGFDLDHLATIDSVTRMVSAHRTLAKIVGFLFSLGHGSVVILISLIIGNGVKPIIVPQWLDGLGNSISITFLLIFGLLNLWNVFRNQSTPPLPTSLKNYLAKKLIRNNFNPFLIILIGALFALSFDTVSQVVLFSLSARAMAGWLFSGVLGIVFMLGMMVSDGLNGLFVSTLIQRADSVSLLFSRMAGLIIASFSLIIGMINLIQMYN